MIKDNYVGIEQKDRGMPIYRFTSMKRLLESLVQKQNTLLSPRKWEDPYENALAASLRYERKDGSTVPYPLRNRVYGQCWTIVPETDAFWRMYVPPREGVRIKSTIRKLHRSLELSCSAYASMSCFIGRVQYKSEEEITSLFNDNDWVKDHFRNQGTPGHVETLLLKRTEFIPESEVRLLYLDPHNRDHGDSFSYDFDPSSTILEVTFDPRMEDTLCQTYESILKISGFTGEINKSHLYRTPKITICV